MSAQTSLKRGLNEARKTEDLTLEEIGEFIEGAGCICRWCSTPLRARDVRSYPHPNGINVKELSGKQWVHFVCSNSKCGYQWALWKLMNQHNITVEGVT